MCHHKKHLCLLLHCNLLWDHFKRILLPDSNTSALLWINWTYCRNIVIPFDGSTADVPKSHSFTALFMISSKSQVIISSTSFLAIKLIYHLSFRSAEQIFSGGWDTISLHHARHNPETIQILVLVKKKLITSRLLPNLISPQNYHIVFYPHQVEFEQLMK